MNKETNRKMVLWMDMHPDSTHPNDINRLYDFVREACFHNDSITAEQLHSVALAAHPNWEGSYLNHFVEEYIVLIEHLMGFFRFCTGSIESKLSDNDISITTTTIEDFFNECGYLNYHEIYDMSQAIAGNSDILTFFTIKDVGEERVISYIISDVSFTFKKKDTVSILKWIEKHYMQGMDPDSWYGYKCTMDEL